MKRPGLGGSDINVTEGLTKGEIDNALKQRRYKSKWEKMSLFEKVEELKRRVDGLAALNTPMAS